MLCLVADVLYLAVWSGLVAVVCVEEVPPKKETKSRGAAQCVCMTADASATGRARLRGVRRVPSFSLGDVVMVQADFDALASELSERIRAVQKTI